MKKEKYNERILRWPLPRSSFGSIETDPFGSYTGVPVPMDEIPQQDADDL